MKYVFLLYDNEDAWANAPEEHRNEVLGAYLAYTEAMTKAGVYIAGEPLDHSKNGKRVAQDKIQDGPFADGKEQLGGFYMADVRNLDEALDWAARCPCASYGYVEVRPVWNIGEQ